MPEQHSVKPGEAICKIAKKYGFRKWRTVWEDGANQPMRDLRKNPNVLHPGDVIVIPDKGRKEFPCNTEKHHVFQVPVLKETLRIKCEFVPGVPIANKPYLLTFGAVVIKGTTDGQGMLEKDIPVDAGDGKLEIGPYIWPVQVGHLNPVTEPTPDDGVTGAQGRLRNLGYDVPKLDGLLGPETTQAIKAFQIDHADEDLAETGQLDEKTRTALRDHHGS
jgi:Putative peptidoglycan binding domain